MPTAWLAGMWGLISGSALVLGAAAGYFLRVPQKVIAIVMAFGSGVLISALAFDLMEEAQRRGGLFASALGFLAGAGLFTAADWVLAQYGARQRKRSGHEQPSEEEEHGSGLAIAVGALIDAIPESIVIGLSLLEGGAVSAIAVAAVFLSNIPEGLSSSAGMKKAGRSARYIFGIWGGIALISGVASWMGYALFQDFSLQVVAGTTAVAAGAILAMLVTTLVPEAVKVTRSFTGLIAVIGFLLAFILSKWGR